MPKPKGLMARYRRWRAWRSESAPHRKELTKVTFDLRQTDIGIDRKQERHSRFEDKALSGDESSDHWQGRADELEMEINGDLERSESLERRRDELREKLERIRKKHYG